VEARPDRPASKTSSRRHEAILTYLRRSRYQIPRESRIEIDWRISSTDGRMDHLKAIARTMRFNRRMAEKQALATV